MLTVNDELGSAEVGRVNDRIPHLVVGAIIPDGTVVIALDEP